MTPSQLAQFSESVADRTKRVMHMPNAEGAHIRRLQMRTLRRKIAFKILGQTFAFAGKT